MDLIIDASGIHYSTPPENFETTLVAIYDKGIAVTQSIEQLEKVAYDLIWIYVHVYTICTSKQKLAYVVWTFNFGGL